MNDTFNSAGALYMMKQYHVRRNGAKVLQIQSEGFRSPGLVPTRRYSLRGHAKVALCTCPPYFNLPVVGKVGLALVNCNDRIMLALVQEQEGSSRT